MENYTLVGWQIIYPRETVEKFFDAFYFPKQHVVIYKTLKEAVQEFKKTAELIGLEVHQLMNEEDKCGDDARGYYPEEFRDMLLVDYTDMECRKIKSKYVAQIAGGCGYKNKRVKEEQLASYRQADVDYFFLINALPIYMKIENDTEDSEDPE